MSHAARLRDAARFLSIASRSNAAFRRQILNIDGLKREARRPDTSFAGEYAHLANLLTACEISGGFCVDVAASNGVSQSSTFALFASDDWAGLAVEMDPVRFAQLAFIYQGFGRAQLARQRVTPDNIVPLLQSHEVPTDFEVLSLDIDSFDLEVLQAMLHAGYRPGVISMEINESVPPPLVFSVRYAEDQVWWGDHFFGCSIVAASDGVKPNGYVLESVQLNNAFFVRSDLAGAAIEDLEPVVAYDRGYRRHPDRTKLFPWNKDVEYVLSSSPDEALAFFERLFSPYAGRFDLTLPRRPDTTGA